MGMSNIELLLVAIGLSADAFAVSVTNGMSVKNIKLSLAFLTALTFGIFQGVMPVIGYFLGSTFTNLISKYDHIIALVLLGFIGVKMIKDSFKDEDEHNNASAIKLTFGAIMLQGVATSIDALAVGVSFAAMSVNIVSAAAFICIVTFVLSFIAVFIGKKFGDLLNNKAEIIGGLILIGIGLKIFIQHAFFDKML